MRGSTTPLHAMAPVHISMWRHAHVRSFHFVAVDDVRLTISPPSAESMRHSLGTLDNGSQAAVPQSGCKRRCDVDQLSGGALDRRIPHQGSLARAFSPPVFLHTSESTLSRILAGVVSAWDI